MCFQQREQLARTPRPVFKGVSFPKIPSARIRDEENQASSDAMLAILHLFATLSPTCSSRGAGLKSRTYES
jgi:hypothetical protein